ncbi:MAG TPA: dihydrodipicolinate synthase family protein [Bryobacteraceae bacterium]|nr:dihydrodipicolinate synthase family protein [Bryobacteraceae bacterium]
MLTLRLPRQGGQLESFTLRSVSPPRLAGRFHCRTAYAAAHVVADPFACGVNTAIDWDATLAFRRHLWTHGFGVAEAMDTAQRGMGLDWTAAQELIARSVREAAAVGGQIACGAGTDQLPADAPATLKQVVEAYQKQAEFVEAQGGRLILMASRALVRCARHADDYAWVYERILSQVRHPVILHWLGDMFDPALGGYWGSRNLDEAAAACLAVIRQNASKIDGIKMSLLDADREIRMRADLPPGVKMYTGDDFDYDRLILGDGQQHSHALLGIFDAIAPVAAAALEALDRGDVAAYRQWMAPTVPLSRHIFEPPTYSYKTGIVFLAYLNGHQRHFRMVAGQESARSVVHLSQLFRLAADAGLLADPKLAVGRMKLVLALAGVT